MSLVDAGAGVESISVVVPFYNLERYVRPCLDSVAAAARRLGEPRPGIEVICVDDGSTDSTGELLDSCAEALSGRGGGLCVRVVHQPNGGEGAARNAGVAAASGGWIAFLDGDDLWLPNHLEAAVPLLRRHPDADIVALRFAPFEDGAEPPSPTDAGARLYDVRDEVPGELVLDVGVFPTFFRRSAFAGERFSSLPLGADRLYVAQCLARAGLVVKSDSVVHGYRVRAGSMARAAWSARKVASMVDFAAGALSALTGSGKRLGREGEAYLVGVLTTVAPKHVRRLVGAEREEARRHLRNAIGRLDASSLGLRHRLALSLTKRGIMV